jgi:hypothetical protein
VLAVVAYLMYLVTSLLERQIRNIYNKWFV